MMKSASIVLSLFLALPLLLAAQGQSNAEPAPDASSSAVLPQFDNCVRDGGAWLDCYVYLGDMAAGSSDVREVAEDFISSPSSARPFLSRFLPWTPTPNERIRDRYTAK